MAARAQETSTSSPRVDAAMVGYAAATLVGLVHAGMPGRGVVPTLVATFPYGLGLGVLVLLRRRAGAGRDLTRPVVLAMAGLGVVLAGWVLVRFAAALPEALGEPFGFYRLKGGLTTPLGDHNTAAGLLLPALVATAVLAARDRRWRLGAGVVAVGLAATLSRGAAVVLAVVVGLAFVRASRRGVAVTLAAAFATVIAVLVVAGSLLDTAAPPGTAAPGPASRSALADVVGASVTGRVDLALRGVEVGADHPLGGVGLGAFGDAAADLPEPNDHAHNQFAHAFAEGGLPLLTATLVVVAALLVRARRVLAGPATARRDVVVLGGAALLLHAQVDILSGLPGYELLLAAVVGLAAPVAAGTPDSLPTPADASPPT